MERLTKTYDDGSFGSADDLSCGENSYDFKDLLINRLGEYEDAEENGLLVRLPLKKGSKVYSVKEEYTVTEISCFDDFELKFIAKNDYSAIRFNVKEIGKTVFLTKAEAEEKLKEMEGENADSD